MSFEIRKLNPEEHHLFAELIEVFADVFEMPPFTKATGNYLQKMLSNEDFIVIISIENQRVTGGLTAYVLHQYYMEKPITYIYDLAVVKSRQRQGIGQNLMAYMIDWSKENGHAEVFVQADRIDDYALDFYRKTNPSTEEDVIHYTYALNASFKKLFG